METVQKLGSKSIVLDVAIKHFLTGDNVLIAQALRFILDAKGQNMDTIQNSFVRRSPVEKYLLVCLILVELMSPLTDDTLLDKDNMIANLLMRYQVSCDAIHKSI